MDTGIDLSWLRGIRNYLQGLFFLINVGMIGVYCLCFGLDFKRSISGWGDLLGFGGFLLWFLFPQGRSR